MEESAEDEWNRAFHCPVVVVHVQLSEARMAPIPSVVSIAPISSVLSIAPISSVVSIAPISSVESIAPISSADNVIVRRVKSDSYSTVNVDVIADKTETALRRTMHASFAFDVVE
ncbi:hypothetical protein BLNAU_10819 [Blattamonas nauphoetae]|uniref:Uncharacterized protein n=1 Tax=Blattamonas nauphoetae TaxID=2049346 RepID=A0ABQ9XRY5_9EUKA|nr:hypothetical protein BLNAU_10819 [Blattamonas nauphoetae]